MLRLRPQRKIGLLRILVIGPRLLLPLLPQVVELPSSGEAPVRIGVRITCSYHFGHFLVLRAKARVLRRPITNKTVYIAAKYSSFFYLKTYHGPCFPLRNVHACLVVIWQMSERWYNHISVFENSHSKYQFFFCIFVLKIKSKLRKNKNAFQ